MDLRLDKLTHNSALRLYRLPKSSQLLRQLGEGWHQPSPDEPPLPTPNNERGSTTLQKLAAKASTGGLRINPFPILPDGVTDWNRRVEIIPRKGDKDYANLTEAIVKGMPAGPHHQHLLRRRCLEQRLRRRETTRGSISCPLPQGQGLQTHGESLWGVNN